MYELIFLCNQNQVEAICKFLEETEKSISISIEDMDAGTENEKSLFSEPEIEIENQSWENSKISVLFHEKEVGEQTWQDLQKIFNLDLKDSKNLSFLELKKLEDNDWVRLTQSQFSPIEITKEFWIVPSWHEIPKEAKISIKLDPGLAFGTGTHATTKMCLQWIAKSQNNLGRVLDYGCGSGILAIASAKFGAEETIAVDIDKEAVLSSQINAKNNQVKINCGFPEIVNGKYQTILANILATPLKVLAPLLCGYLENGGNLILAGILKRQAEELKLSYLDYVNLNIIDSCEDWILMTAKNRNIR